MRKTYKMTMILLTSAILSGCSSSHKSAGIMDFQAEVEWRVPNPAIGEKPRILFVGNSHTFYNNLSEMFVNIVSAFGHKSDVHELSTGYYTLKQFADTKDQGGAILDKALTEEDWDFVILQENTAKALSSSASEDMFPSARILDKKIKTAGGQTVFLMTWAPKNGMRDGRKERKCNEIQSELASNYIAIADELNGLLIPAGVGFMRCLEEYPDIELWDKDGHHPSPAGSYLTACTAYALLYQESPENCPYTADLDKEQALALQRVAAEMMLN